MLNTIVQSYKQGSLALLLLIMCTPLCFPNYLQAKDKKADQYILATASTGGTFYPVGVAIATLSKLKIAPTDGFSLSAINSAGSGENIKLMQKNEAQFAILQGLYGAWAVHGEGAFADHPPYQELRAVTMLWENIEQFTLLKKWIQTGDLTDLTQIKDQPFSIGKRFSGTEGSGRMILASLGIDADQMSLVHLGYGASADALQNGRIVGMNTPSGIPTAALTRAFASRDDLRLLEVTKDQLSKINQKYALWRPYTIPANTYQNQTQAVQTIAQPNFLAVRADIPEKQVYKLCKTIYENLAYLGGIHKATKAMSLDQGDQQIPVPLHPGAKKCFQDLRK